MIMRTVLTRKVLLTVNVILGFLEMDKIVQVWVTYILKFPYFTPFLCLCSCLICFSDVNECLRNPCHYNASCTDNEGSFNCQCKVGFSGDGHSCSGTSLSVLNPLFGAVKNM
jgi:hypothetical protein